jgi:hypothetical protein
MIILDSLLIGGLKFVFGKLAQAVDAELNDDTVLKEELLAAQMRLELGEISEAEFAAVERDLLSRIREVRDRNTTPAPPPGEMKVSGVEATFTGDEHEPSDER